jgi:hypothetical protein
MAFQANAFQSDAFQICASDKPDQALQRRKRRREEELEARRRYEQALEVLEQVKDEKTEQALEAVILPFKSEGEIDMATLMTKGQAKRRLEQILTSIRQLEDELLELLALLLLANEAL